MSAHLPKQERCTRVAIMCSARTSTRTRRIPAAVHTAHSLHAPCYGQLKNAPHLTGMH